MSWRLKVTNGLGDVRQHSGAVVSTVALLSIYFRKTQMASSDYTMGPVDWLFVSLFAGVILVIAIVYLFAIKIRRDKKKAARKAGGDKNFGKIIKNPLTAPAV